MNKITINNNFDSNFLANWININMKNNNKNVRNTEKGRD